MAAPSTTLSREQIYDTHSGVPHQFHQYGLVYSFGVTAVIHMISPSSLHVGTGLPFQVVFHPITQFTLILVGIKPGDSGVAIVCQVDELHLFCRVCC